MRRVLAVLSVCALVLAPELALCADHLVKPAAARERIATAATEREHNIRALERVLSSPAAVSAAAAFGTRAERLKAGVSTLSDDELRDLADRAAALDKDPVAGLHDTDPEVHEFLVIFMIVAIVVLVLDAVD